jgi:2,5-diketo-D-gluconate reductase A
VVLRWHRQRGHVAFPKSVTPQRIKDNFALFDFEHGDTDMQTLTALDKGADGRTGADPDAFDYVPS